MTEAVEIPPDSPEGEILRTLIIEQMELLNQQVDAFGPRVVISALLNTVARTLLQRTGGVLEARRALADLAAVLPRMTAATGAGEAKLGDMPVMGRG